MTMTGGCLCGAVRYEITAEPIFAAHCHCRDCQRATGAGHVSAMGFPRQAVRITGETRTFSSPGSSGRPVARHFCPTCGSLLFSEPEAIPGVLNVTAGSLDDPSQFRPQAAIYTRSRVLGSGAGRPDGVRDRPATLGTSDQPGLIFTQTRLPSNRSPNSDPSLA